MTTCRGLIEPGADEFGMPSPRREEHGLALAAAAAERGDAELGAVAPHLVGEGEQQSEAGGGERVAERDGAAVDVDPLGVDAPAPRRRPPRRRRTPR